MEDYYPEELGEIIRQWNELYDPEREEIVEMKAEEFLGGGGEWLE